MLPPVFRWLCWWRPPFLLQSVIINLKDDSTTALEGVLWSVRGPWYTLTQASLLHAGDPPMPSDGPLVVHRANIAYVQITTGASPTSRVV